ncbi:VWA domain-containing protein [Streptomyces sp. NPDC051286]|uniref:VWA domain-containing protein n=1 Tax=Streptomyces sp. NPDC051286 TaxID=3365647 RepID=UPI0037B5EDBE
MADWGRLPKKTLLPRDAEPGNLLLRRAKSYSLFDGESVARAIQVIGESARPKDLPMLVLFFTWGNEGEDREIAGQLDRAAGANVFWLFFGDTELNMTVLDRLADLRVEAPHIGNVNFYQGWNYSIATTHPYMIYRGLMKPFSAWRRSSGC